MAKVKRPPSFVRRLKMALANGLQASGIDATIRTEPVPTTRMYRVAVLAPQFKALKHSERQGLVWRIVEQALSPDEQLRVSMILTLAPEEANE